MVFGGNNGVSQASEPRWILDIAWTSGLRSRDGQHMFARKHPRQGILRCHSHILHRPVELYSLGTTGKRVDRSNQRGGYRLHVRSRCATQYSSGAVYPSYTPSGTIVYKPLWITFALIIESLFSKIKATSEESFILIAPRDTVLPKLVSGAICVVDT